MPFPSHPRVTHTPFPKPTLHIHQRQTKQKSLSHLNPPSPHLRLDPPGVSITSDPTLDDDDRTGLDATPLSVRIKLFLLCPVAASLERPSRPLDCGVRMRTEAPV